MVSFAFFKCELHFPEFFVCQVILDCILDFVAYYNLLKNVDIFILASNTQVRYEPQVLSYLVDDGSSFSLVL